MSPAAPQLLCPTLVGRDEPLGALVSALDRAIAGHGRATLVSGEAGIGKTALLRRFVELARDRGARVAIGECIEIEAKRPLGPFSDIVEDLARAGLLRSGITRPDLEGGPADDEQRYRVYLSFAALFTQLGRAAPLIVVVEDLHWADEATLELFGYLARKLRDGRVLLVGTYRSDELHRQHPLRPLLADLGRARLTDEIVVDRLSPTDLSKFLRVTMRLDRDPSPAFRDAMQERCEGNPLFAEEVLKALQQRGDLELREGQWRRTKGVGELALPDSIRDAVQARLGPLSPRARRALQIAAVIGQTFHLELLHEVSQVTEEDLARDLRAAIDAQIVVGPTDDAPRLAFRHALTRESVLADLLEPERRELHRAIGLAIERAGADDRSRVEELAYHFDEAGDAERAFRYRILAADAASASAAFARAARHLERAIALAPRGQSVASVYLNLSLAALLAGDLHRAARAAAEGSAAYRADGDLLRAGAALIRLAKYQWQLGEPAGAATAQDAVTLLEPLGRTSELAAAYAELARQNFFLHDERRVAREWAEGAIEIAREVGVVSVLADTLITLGLALLDVDPVRGAELTREAIDLARRSGLVFEATRGYGNLTLIAQWGAIPGLDPDAVFREGLAFVEPSGHRQSYFWLIRALHAFRDGDFDAVLELASQVSAETRYGRLLDYLALLVRTAREGPTHAISAMPVPFASALGGPTRRLEAAARARLQLVAGDPQAALEETEAVASLVDFQLPRSANEIELVVIAIEAARALGKDDVVARWSALGRGWAPSGTLGAITGEFAAAEDSAKRGEIRPAADSFGAVADAFRQQLLTVPETLARLRRTEMLARFDVPAAEAELARVAAFWRKGKATWYLGQLERWAEDHQLRLPVEQHATKPKQTLSEREREVARLVADGLSNKEIAERLVVSERTAEGHVQRILDKLNFRSRAQIAVWEAESRTGAGRA